MQNRIIVPAALVALGSGIAFSSALAQQDRLPGVVDSFEDSINVPQTHRLNQEIKKPIYPKPSVEAVATDAEVVAYLDEVIFEGNTALDEVVLQRVVDPYIHQSLTKKDLAKLKYDVTRAYYDRGYILVRVVTPPQKLSDGVLKITVHEARIGDVTVADNELLHPYISDAFIRSVKKGTVFTETLSESLVSDLDDLPNISATVNLRPGSAFKTTDLEVVLRAANEDIQYLSLDNYGSPLTGRHVASAHIEKSNLLKIGERFSADVRRSEDELWSVRLGADVPTGISNIIFETSYLWSKNEIGDRLSALDAKGETHQFTGGFSSNLINTRDRKAAVRAGVEVRTHESTQFAGLPDTKDDLREVYVQAEYLERHSSLVWFASARLIQGLSVLGANDKADASATRLLADPAGLRLEPSFLANYRPFGDGTLKLRAVGQFAADPMMSSNLFILGGYNSVRGFELAQETGDSGYRFTVEYSHEIPVDERVRVAVGPFLDGGAVYNRLANSSTDSHLYSVGLGAELGTDITKLGETLLRFDWGHPIGSYNSNLIDDDLFYFRIKQEF